MRGCFHPEDTPLNLLNTTSDYNSGDVYGFDRDFCWNMRVKYYGELPIISFYPSQNDSGFSDIAIFLPIIGCGIEIWRFDRPPYLSIAFFYKVDDDWEPARCSDQGF